MKIIPNIIRDIYVKTCLLHLMVFDDFFVKCTITSKTSLLINKYNL